MASDFPSRTPLPAASDAGQPGDFQDTQPLPDVRDAPVLLELAPAAAAVPRQVSNKPAPGEQGQPEVILEQQRQRVVTPPEAQPLRVALRGRPVLLLGRKWDWRTLTLLAVLHAHLIWMMLHYMPLLPQAGGGGGGLNFNFSFREATTVRLIEETDTKPKGQAAPLVLRPTRDVATLSVLEDKFIDRKITTTLPEIEPDRVTTQAVPVPERLEKPTPLDITPRPAVAEVRPKTEAVVAPVAATDPEPSASVAEGQAVQKSAEAAVPQPVPEVAMPAPRVTRTLQQSKPEVAARLEVQPIEPDAPVPELKVTPRLNAPKVAPVATAVPKVEPLQAQIPTVQIDLPRDLARVAPAPAALPATAPEPAAAPAAAATPPASNIVNVVVNVPQGSPLAGAGSSASAAAGAGAQAGSGPGTGTGTGTGTGSGTGAGSGTGSGSGPGVGTQAGQSAQASQGPRVGSSGAADGRLPYLRGPYVTPQRQRSLAELANEDLRSRGLVSEVKPGPNIAAAQKADCIAMEKDAKGNPIPPAGGLLAGPIIAYKAITGQCK